MNQSQGANGVGKCARCGASDVSFDGAFLVCGYCHHRWNTAVVAEDLQLSDGIEHMVGTTVLTGAKDIDTSSLVTLVCDGCGASVTINSEMTLQSSCHWCRHVLSLNHPTDNGAVPDAILPFYVGRQEALDRMNLYVSQRAAYASADFMADFSKGAIHAVYLPYLVVDGTASVRLEGRAWARASGWAWGGGSTSSDDPLFFTEEYDVTREAAIRVDDLAIEARSTRTRLYAAVSTSNIINAIQPFDVTNAVRFDANYITEGVVYEKRDIEVAAALTDAAELFATIARGYVNQTLTQYTGGVRWESERTSIQGTRWLSMLLPVWLYAFEEATPTGPMMHYIAVNGRTGETEGSVPTDDTQARRSGRRWGWGAAAIFATIFGGPTLIFVPILAATTVNLTGAAFTATIFGVFAVIVGVMGLSIGKRVATWRSQWIAKAQRNPDARLKAEFEARYTPTRLDRSDTLLEKFSHHGGPEIEGRNDHRPHDRAPRSEVVQGELPASTADGRAQPPSGADAQRVAHDESRGRRRVGQAPSAPPPGATVSNIAYFALGSLGKR